jgi:hypothetical protein
MRLVYCKGSQRMFSIADAHLCYTTCIYRYLCHTDNISKIVSVAITRRNEDMKNIIISNVEMMSLQVISHLRKFANKTCAPLPLWTTLKICWVVYCELQVRGVYPFCTTLKFSDFFICNLQYTNLMHLLFILWSHLFYGFLEPNRDF